MTWGCEHEWVRWTKLDPFDYGYRCRKCGMEGSEYVRSMRHMCPLCGAEISYIPLGPYFLRGPSETWGRCGRCDLSFRLDQCPCKAGMTRLEDFA